MAHFAPERETIRQQLEERFDALSGMFYRLHSPITDWETVVSGTEQDASPPPDTGWQPYSAGDEWGGPDVSNWFRATATVPDAMAGQPVYAILRTGGEGLCYVNGEPLQGLDDNRWPVRLCASGVPGERFDILIDAYAKTGVQRFASPALAVRDDLTWNFYWDLRTAFEAAFEQPDGSHAHLQLLDIVDRTARLVDIDRFADTEYWTAAVAAARSEFSEKIAKFEWSVSSGALTLASHSHIDVAWMWRLRETRRKVGRTFSTVLNLMDEYPEVTFLQSQPQLYEYLKEHYPSLWERVKERVREGRWEVNGAGWVEQDMNLPSGESHVRQYLFGNRFFRSEFGVHARMVWMPDCFGFTFSLPQIMKKAQIDCFGTWKLIYNDYQQHPYCLFRWRGLDGTEIPAISLPSLCGGDPNPHEIKRHWDGFRQKDLTDEFMHVFGHGDGGGGPTAEMFEYVRRQENLPSIPRSKFGSFQEAFDRLVETTDPDRVPVFNDEMYLELHRGCQTSQARTKRNNRKSELLARDAEYFASRAFLDGAPYPHESINAAWKLVLLNQFHDILPGSSIAEVYEDAEQDYATVRDTLTTVRDGALGRLDDAADENAVVVRNTLGWERSDIVDIAVGDSDLIGTDGGGTPLPSQTVSDENGDRRLLFETGGVPSLGARGYSLVSGVSPTPDDAPTASPDRLENAFYLLEFAADGTISRLTDKREGREVIAPNAPGNELVLYEDRPAQYDAWDIDFNYTDVQEPVDNVVSMEVVESGPVRATVRIVKTTGRSTITQDISLWRTTPRIDFRTRVDWHEKSRLLKALFPVNVLSRTATYEIQFGAIERPTHFSTSEDRARFEVPAHRWIDLSERRYGVSLLNDCKYGFGVHQNVMSISLLRSPINPDPHADEGEQVFTYSLFPHAGSWQDAETVRRAYELNVPLVAQAGASPTSTTSFATVDAPNVVIDTVKKAEDTGDVIVRLYESHGARGPVRLEFERPPKSVSECDLMEENDEAAVVDGNGVAFEIKPWEIRTFKVSW